MATFARTDTAPALPSKRDRPRVLIVDDEPRVLEGLKLHLGRRHDIETVVDGRAAIRALEAQDFHVLITDMRMPVMTGVDVLREALRVSPDTVRILLTGYADIETAARAINEGRIFRFLTKPCPPPLVSRALRDALVHYRQKTQDQAMVAGEVQEICMRLIETDRLASLGVLAGALSRELGNLGEAALGVYQELAEAGALAERFENQIDDVRWIGRQLQAHTRTLSRMLTESATDQQRFDIRELVRQTIEDVAVLGSLRQTDTDVNICQAEAWIEGNRALLRQALVQLLLRAAHPVESDPEHITRIVVTVAVDFGEGDVRVSLFDDRPADPDPTEHGGTSFEATPSLDSASGPRELSTVRHIVEEHQGTLEVRPGERAGSCVEITLPLVDLGWQEMTLIDVKSSALGGVSTWAEDD